MYFSSFNFVILTLDLRFGAAENVIVKPRAGVSHTAISRGREIQGVCPQVSLEEVQLKIPRIIISSSLCLITLFVRFIRRCSFVI